jgi:PEP-CTERM motif
MTKRTMRLTSAAVLALAALFASSAEAKYVVLFREVGSDVVETGSGALDLTDLTDIGGSSAVTPSVVPNVGFFSSGAPGTQMQAYFGAVTGPSEFGAGEQTVADKSSGDGVGVFGGGENDFYINAPVGYISGAPLADTSTYLFATLASLGARPGEYVWSWGSGAHADTFTVEIGGVFPTPIPEPSTWAMFLMGFAGLGFARYRKAKDKKKAQSPA